MDETQTDDIPQVSIEENPLLTVVYSEDEVKRLFSKRNTTRHQVCMVSLLIFIRISGILSKQSFWLCSTVFMLEN
jgi:hypothetical protein